MTCVLPSVCPLDCPDTCSLAVTVEDDRVVGVRGTAANPLTAGVLLLAAACATNPVAPIIPCHRAVRKDGGLAGYRWGLHRKEALLDMERQQSN